MSNTGFWLLGAPAARKLPAAVGAEKGEPIEQRLSYRSGYYARSLITWVGKLESRVPQDRSGRFSTEIFERYQRTEKALIQRDLITRGIFTSKADLARKIAFYIKVHHKSAKPFKWTYRNTDGRIR
jgi:putative transposase